jgi:hypothetical protein
MIVDEEMQRVVWSITQLLLFFDRNDLCDLSGVKPLEKLPFATKRERQSLCVTVGLSLNLFRIETVIAVLSVKFFCSKTGIQQYVFSDSELVWHRICHIA